MGKAITERNMSSATGSLRLIADYLLTECRISEQYGKWLDKGTGATWEAARKDYDEWYDRAIVAQDSEEIDANEAFEVITQYVSASEQMAFEKGARFGARMTIELLGAGSME